MTHRTHIITTIPFHTVFVFTEVQDSNKMSVEHPLVLKFIFSRSLFKLFRHLNRLHYAFQTRINTNSDRNSSKLGWGHNSPILKINFICYFSTKFGKTSTGIGKSWIMPGSLPIVYWLNSLSCFSGKTF